MWSKVAVGLSATALAVSLLGITPASAVNTVKRALFAKNSGAVDGVSASRTPRAGQLLPLSADGRFPASVLPPAAAGPRGPRGPAGPAASTSAVGFASRDPANSSVGAVPVSAGATDLIGLDVPGGSGGYNSSSGVVSATGPSRLVANAQMVILSAGPGAIDVACQISLIGPTEQRLIGNYVNTHLLQGAYQPISVSAGADVEIGTYNVRAQCRSAAANVTFHRGNLIVTLAPR